MEHRRARLGGGNRLAMTKETEEIVVMKMLKDTAKIIDRLRNLDTLRCFVLGLDELVNAGSIRMLEIGNER
ncbi:MAG: hypothetical protein EOM62_20455 [Bacteroidia bacterium]|nr:hypothetical protein [Bacteroidia bacterium]